MADTVPRIDQAEPEHVIEENKEGKRFSFWAPAWHQLALAGIALISIFMDFFQLGANGYGSYYPPAVRSMMDNWHNFFFASYDPGGFVTVDKPPVGFWFQVASAKIFGFSPFSILLPQALAGVLSVLLLYYLVKRHFGVVAGLLAALALAISPISVVTNRNITIDSTLALTLLVGAWAVIRAAETGKLRWLLLSAFMVGIGFNIKMLEAYLVVPAFGLLYLLAAPRSIRVRIGHLALAALVLLVVSFSWIAAVDLTPASQRPYVDSTQDNSELSLALGYNGIERLLGNVFGRGRGIGTTPPNRPANAGGNGTSSTTGTPPTTGNGGTFPFGRNTAGQQPQATFGGIFNTGAASPLRLFDVPLGSQISWLLPLALLGMLALAWQGRPRFRNFQEDPQQKSLLLWGMWLLTMAIFFSVAGFFHQYYMTEMAPAVAALFGIGVVIMWKDYRQNGWRGWLLPLALLATLAEQIYILMAYPTWGQWMIPLIVVPTIIAVVVLIGARLAPRLSTGRIRETWGARINSINAFAASAARFLIPALCVGLLALMIAPTVWAITPILLSKQADTLVAGPPQTGDARGNFGGGANNGTASSQSMLIRYLEANQGNAKFLVAVPSSQGITDTLIIATNKPVMSLGGFSGSDPILTTTQLASLVANGTVRFFLLNSFRGRGQLPQQILNQLPPQVRERIQQGLQGGGFAGPGFGGGQQGALTSWVTQHCKTVPSNLWQSASASSGSGPGGGGFGFGGANQLYDCAGAH